MNDPYMPVERELHLTGRALEVIAEFGFPVHIITKSDLVLRDIETLVRISRVYATVTFTITTADDELGRIVEPGAPACRGGWRPCERSPTAAFRPASTLMPVLPFIEDSAANIEAIVSLAAQHGASYIVASMGMTLRDRQRAYYYQRLDESFPGLREKYVRAFGGNYMASALHADRLWEVFHEACNAQGLATRVIPYRPGSAEQPALF